MKDHQKIIVRAAIRKALYEMNQKSIFSCGECVCCVPADDGEGDQCHAAMVGLPSYRKISAHLMQKCFTYNYMDSPLVEVLNMMMAMNIDFHGATHGWATVVNRVMHRLDRFGHNMNITRRNLERFK